MEEVEFEYRVEEDEKEIVEDVGERRFKVGDLVEFWEVALVRGYRTDSGDPAWVKARLSQSKEIQPVQRETQPGSPKRLSQSEETTSPRETQPGSPKRLSLSSGKSKHPNMDKHAP